MTACTPALDFEALYKEHARSLRHVLHNKGGIPQDEVDDAVQDVFMLALQWQHSFNPAKGNISSWLHFQVAKAVATRRASRRRRMGDNETTVLSHYETDDGTDLLEILPDADSSHVAETQIMQTQACFDTAYEALSELERAIIDRTGPFDWSRMPADEERELRAELNVSQRAFNAARVRIREVLSRAAIASLDGAEDYISSLSEFKQAKFADKSLMPNAGDDLAPDAAEQPAPTPEAQVIDEQRDTAPSAYTAAARVLASRRAARQGNVGQLSLFAELDCQPPVAVMPPVLLAPVVSTGWRLS